MTNQQTAPELTPEQENEPVTKGYLRQELDQRFGEFGKKMFDTFATKKEFNELKIKVDGIDKKIDGLITTLDIDTRFYKNHLEEHAMHQAAHDRINERITKLESNPVVA
ncbi:MAG: hypothetical protein WCW25_00610 [Patescibacteria group bacterium]|jgi:hypothetical protein